MDTLFSIFAKIIGPFVYPLISNQRIFWLYLLSSIVLAAAVLVLRRPRTGASGIAALLKRIFPKKILTHRSARVDYKFYVVNTIAVGLLIAPILLGSRPIAALTERLLHPIIGGQGPTVTPSAGDHFLYTACMIVAFDGALFLAHYLQHKIPTLWEFHKVHHSAEVLTPITVYRMHPVDTILAGTLTAIAAGVMDGVFQSFYIESPTTLLIYNLNIFLFLFYLLGYNLRHSHVWLSYPALLSRIFISPAQHQIHHSLDPKHFDKNFGFIFAFWDGVAGSLYVPKQREELDYGLMGNEHLAFDSVWALYARPFRVVFDRLLPKRSRS